MKMRQFKGAATIGAALAFCFFTLSSAYGADTASLDQLEEVIKKQQTQIDAQQKMLKQLQAEVDGIKARPAADNPGAVKAGNPKAAVKVYGQVNKAVLYSSDGDRGYFYLVDNDNSSTRMGVLGSIDPNERYDVGTRIEFEYQTNPSNLVSQDDMRLDDIGLQKRHLDLWVNAKAYGKFSLGWGSTASDGTSEVDLSGTTVIGYSSISDMAGGQLFFDKGTAALSDTQDFMVYGNMDGLGRDERVRYDTPSFNGYMGSASYITGGGGDVALRYSGQVDGARLAVGVAYADPGSTSSILDAQLAGSASVLFETGISITLALGTRDNKEAGRDDTRYLYTKLGYRTSDWCPMGVTSLSVDYGKFRDFDLDGDDADTIGFQMVQDLHDWGSETYLGYRFHVLERIDENFDNVNAVMIGMRVKF